MGSANLTDNDKIMRYPQSIIDWELKHGIVRYEKNGMLYVRGHLPEEMIFESIRQERMANENKPKRGETL
jgi:hypothetical protein